MGMTLNGILTTGTSGLEAYQAALAVTSNNVSNSSTPGYTRERADLVTAPSVNLTPGQFGDGAAVLNVDRLRDTLLDGNARQELGLQAKYNQMASTGTSVESVFGDPTNPTLNSDLNNFFAAYNSLTTSPEDLGVRQTVISDAQTMATDFNSEYSQLTTLTSSLNTTINQASSDINTMLQQVAALNKQIAYGEGSGNNPNEALDQRDLLLDKLSNYMDLTVSNTPNGNGMIDISVNGKVLVNGINVNGLGGNAVTTFQGGIPPHWQVVANDGTNTDLATAGGQLAGIAQSYQTIDTAQKNLDDLAGTFITQVNNLTANPPSTSYDLNGNAGVVMFNGTDASTIAVNPAVATDPSKVVAADTPNSGSNGIALQIALLQNTAVNFPVEAPPFTTLPSSTLNQAVTNIVAGLGSSTKASTSLYNTYTTNVNTVQTQRQSENGVSTDKEVSNMIAFQRGYEASAKVISAVDMLMGIVINMGGAAT